MAFKGHVMQNEVVSFNKVSKRELFEALKQIGERAYSPIDDNYIWMDDQTPLGLFVDSFTQRF